MVDIPVPVMPGGSATIASAIEAADARLEPDEVDLDHALEFPIPSLETRADGRALAEQIVRACASRGLSTFLPRFGAAGDGGVALHWRTPRSELLVRVSPVTSSGPVFFGETKAGAFIKGALAPGGSAAFLAQWLADNELSG